MGHWVSAVKPIDPMRTHEVFALGPSATRKKNYVKRGVRYAHLIHDRMPKETQTNTMLAIKQTTQMTFTTNFYHLLHSPSESCQRPSGPDAIFRHTAGHRRGLFNARSELNVVRLSPLKPKIGYVVVVDIQYRSINPHFFHHVRIRVHTCGAGIDTDTL